MRIELGNYRIISTLLTIVACISISFKNTPGFIIGLVVLFIALYFMFHYRCPSCKKVFDARLSPSRLEYCPRCGEKVK